MKASKEFMGHTGKLFASALKARGVQVVGIDLGPPDDFDEWCDQNKVPMIFGTFNLRAPLEKAGASKARSIIFASGDELVTQGIVDLTGIFEPAQASDLLRSKIISSSTMH